METAAVGSTVRGGGGYAGEAAAGQELGGERVAALPPRDAEAHPLFIQNREVAILNIFTGFIGLAIAVTFIIDGNLARIPAVGLVSIRNGGAILLFAFTYLWVAYNQYANAGGRGLGWYSAFVAVTAIVFGVYTVQATPDSNTADLWLVNGGSPRAVQWACSGHAAVAGTADCPRSRGGWPSSKAPRTACGSRSRSVGKLGFA
jgi:hypothetical protein